MAIDVYDIAVLLGRMYIDLTLRKDVPTEKADEMVRSATLSDLLDVRDKWMEQRGYEFSWKYSVVRRILENEHNTSGRLGQTPMLRDSRAYREWREVTGTTV